MTYREQIIAVEFNEVMDGEIESAKAALAKVRKP